MQWDKKTAVSVVVGMMAFGALMYGIKKLPSSVPGATQIKKAADAIQG